uniref:C2H2-type domain-containing protein n=1 Tax=Cyprinodon variegatus TaxID=28743 RepID=A0A3Q2G2J8_CYPVA
MFPADLKQTVKEEVPEDHKPSPDLHDPEPHHIKEEQEEVCTSLGGEQLGLKEEIDAIKFPITAAPIKSEDDKHSSVLPQLYHHHIKGRELPVENHGGEESMRIQDHEDGSISSETEEDSDVELSVSELKQLAAFGLKTKNMEISWKKVTAPKPEGNMADKHFISEFAVQLLQKDMKHSEIGPSSSLDKMKSFKENNVDSQRSSKKTTEFICEDCGKTFTEKHELNMHKTIHTGSKPFCCDLCKQRFSRKQLGVKEEIDAIKFPITAAPIKSEDDKHSSVLPQLYHHHIKGRELPLSVSELKQLAAPDGNMADKPSGSSDSLGNKKCFTKKKHVDSQRNVHKRTTFSCEDCGKIFTGKNKLNLHQRIHAGEKPFGCDVCGQTFIHRGHLNTHFRIHTGDKPFACKECGRRFSHKSNLNAHIRIHTAEKPFCCDKCGMKFSRVERLNKHMSIHAGQKPFCCDRCGRRFSRLLNLNKHHPDALSLTQDKLFK